MIKETKKRILTKSIVWRVFATGLTFIIALVVAKSVTTAGALALTIALIDQSIKFLGYTVYEHLWTQIKYGRELVKAEGATIWLTGFSGSGKTTIARALVKKLEDKLQRVDYLDGDIVRKSFCADLGFTKEDRDENVRRVTYVAQHVSKHALVVCAFIAPYLETRAKIRTNTNNYIEVHVDCPIEVCESRDVKGLYALARAGKLKNFTGIDDPYEAPETPDIYLNTSKQTLDECIDIIVNYLENKGLLQ
jgi:adenylylsulfate kinase